LKSFAVIILNWNNAKTVERTIQDARSLTDKVYVYDINSTDGSLDLAIKNGAILLKHPFDNDIGKLKNTLASLIEEEFIFWLNGDEEISSHVVDNIIGLMKEPSKMTVWQFEIFSPIYNQAAYTSYQVRLVPNNKEILFNGIVQDHCLKSAMKNSYAILETGSRIIKRAYEAEGAYHERIQEQVKVAEAFISKNSKDFNAFLTFCHLHLAAGNYKDAIMGYKLLLDKSEGDPSLLELHTEVLHTVSDLNLLSNKTVEAEEFIESAKKLNMNKLEQAYLEGRLAWQNGDSEEAKKKIKPLFLGSLEGHFYGKNPWKLRDEGLRLYIKILKESREFSRASEELEKYIVRNPKSFVARILMGELYLELKRFQDAADLYKKAALDFPDEKIFSLRQENVMQKTPFELLDERPDDLKPEFSALLPKEMEKILILGCGDGAIAHGLFAKGAKEIRGISESLDPEDEIKAGQILSSVAVGDSRTCLKSLPKDYFDLIIINDGLDTFISPREILKGIVPIMTQGATVLVSVSNIQNRKILEGLLNGKFTYQNLGILSRATRRLFNKNTSKSLFLECEFSVEAESNLCDPRFKTWQKDRPPFISLGEAELDVSGMPDEDVQQYFNFKNIYLLRHEPSALAGEKLDRLRNTVEVEKLERLIKLGSDSIDVKNFEDAASYFGRVLELNPKEPRAYNYLGIIAFYGKKFEHSYELFKRSVELDSNSEDFALNYFDAAAKVDKTQEAKDFLNPICKQHPEHRQLAVLLQ